MAKYLEELTLRLAGRLANVPESIRQKHGEFFLSAQQPDGGFAGREGGSDLYYTSFGLRGVALLGLLEGEVAEKSAHFLSSRLAGQESIIDFLSLVYSAKLLEVAAGIDVFAAAAADWRSAVDQSLQKLRRDDGGYAKGESGRASSTYHTFLVLLCLELIDKPIPDSDGIVRFLESQRCDEGGFREIRVSKRAGTNPTAAAIGALRILGQVERAGDDTIDFLTEMQNEEGGLRANTRIPIADLLSSFTGYLTLQDLDSADRIDREELSRYINSLQIDTGGFHGAAWDVACDVEYTFYGLGCLALLAE